MKKTVCNLLLLLLISNEGFSQIGEKFNRLSFDFNVGSSLPVSNLSANYFTNYLGVIHIDAGARYMLREKLGVKIDYGFDRMKNDEFKVNSTSLPFTSFNNRINVQGVFNFGKALRFSDWTKRFGLIVHSGVGISLLSGDSSTSTIKAKIMEVKPNFIFGFSPQFNITNKIAANLDFSFVSNLNQRYNFDFKEEAINKNGLLTNVSLGMSYYFGKEKTHVDWLFKKEPEIIKEIVIPVDSNLIVKNNYDQDNDGVLDSIDFCPEIPGIIAFDGCPKPELSFDCNLNNFPVFQFNGARSDLQELYLPYIDSIADCMLANKDKKIIIYGFTDNFGDEIYTEGLSQSRANKIKNSLVEKGVAEDRIFTLGESRKKANLSEENQKNIKHNRLAYIEAISKNQDDIKMVASGEYLQGLFFTVQIGAYKRELKNNKFGKLGKVLVTKTSDGIHRYSINVYTDFAEADKKWRELRGYGFAQDAFVAAYFLGERITIQEAKRLIAEKGNSILQK
jgi:OOP family OmpA-OmpF porin